MGVTRTFDLLDKLQKEFPKKDALAGKKNGKWVTYSTDDYINHVNYISYALLSLGFKKGDKIATISNNRPEWNFVDFGMAQVGVIHVPIYPNISQEDYKYILKHSGVKAVFISNRAILNKIKPILKRNRKIKHIYSFAKMEEVQHFQELIEKGRQHENTYPHQLLQIKQNISPDELVSIIYTSGTTGWPKGVMLSHNNIVSNFKSTSKAHKLGYKHRALSFLPLCHIYERMMNYHFQYKGISIYYSENLGTISKDLKEVKPHIFNTVPRLLEKVYDTILGKGQNLPYLKKVIFFWAVRLGMKYRFRQTWRPFYNIKLKLARRLIFNKWKEALGGEIVVIVSGGAALQKRIEHVFWAADIPVIEGYGLTETSPVIAVNKFDPFNAKLGTVGPVLENVQVKISQEGEILCKGPNVMRGYYKQPELTKSVIDNDGWFHTGDIGTLDEDNFLTITDRKKSMFKNAGGKYIAPQVVENKLKESFFIEQAMVIGENEKFVSALLSPNFEFLHDWCSIHHVRYRDNKELVEHPEVVERYQKEINKYNAQLGEAEKIRRFKLVCEEWSPETGELSPTQKLKREFIYEKYADIISEIYKHDKKKNGNNLIDIPLRTLKEIKRELNNGLTSIKNSSRN